jgi:SAM-dependent methyltransferase
MAQITHGIRQILSSSLVYELFQNLVGATQFRRQIVARYLRPKAGMQVIDVGCGTGAMLEHLPEGIRYHGFDLSSLYVEHAQNRFGNTAEFHCADVADAASLGLPKADLIIVIGLLHHLDDAVAINLIRDIALLLAPGGRCIAVDGCFEENQSRIAEWFLKRDRGQNVRSPSGYLSLANAAGVEPRIELSHDLLRIPYTHSILEFSA